MTKYQFMDLLTVLDAQEEFDANGEARRGEGAQGAEAADGARVAVDTSREDSEVAGSEGVGGVGEEGEDMGAFFVEGQVGFLQGCEAVVIDCTQRQRSRARERRGRRGYKQHHERACSHGDS